MRAGGIGMILFALFILGVGLVDLGKSLGWWAVSIPFWPVVFILIGVWLLLTAIERKFV